MSVQVGNFKNIYSINFPTEIIVNVNEHYGILGRHNTYFLLKYMFDVQMNIIKPLLISNKHTQVHKI